MIESIKILSENAYNGLTALILHYIGDYHIYNFYYQDTSTNGDIVLGFLKSLDIPWILSCILLITCVFCVYRIISTIISRF